MYNDSPRYLRFNTLNHLAESHVETSRAATKADLVDKIVYDDPAVFKRLHVDQVDRNFAATCAASFNAANAEDISLLMELEERASKKTPEELDIEETTDTANDRNKEERSGNHGSAEEKKYDPLKTNSMLKADEPHTFGFPSCSPDIVVSQTGIDASRSNLWRDRDAFGEVKPLKKQGPKPVITGTMPAIVIQSADYARLFMSARPFMLSCVGIFDRDGISFSPAYDMFLDTETFIRVVRSLACNLSMEDVGFDPTVRILTDAETQKLTGSTEGYPHAVVSSGGSALANGAQLPPIWTSLPFLGRVREYVVGVNKERGNDMIMKTAWRSSSRTLGSDIYMSIDQFPEGLAKFECGDDVKFAGYPITVQNLRSHPVHNFLPEGDINPPTPVLHRLILGTVGRPWWEYTSDFDLLAGFGDALQAHKALCDQGILYHDISAGNVLLTRTQKAPLRGFLTDLEFAHITNSTLSKPRVTVPSAIGPQKRYDDRLSRTQPMTRTHTTFESTVTVKRGAGMTGMAQFMAQRILLQEAKRTTEWVMDEFEATHDIESFV